MFCGNALHATLKIKPSLQNLGRFQHMPSPGELANMRQDLDFKEGEMHKSKTTASGLAGGNSR